MSEHPPVNGDAVVLEIPADPAYVRLARLAAADMGSRAGLDFEALEDVRLAVDELCSALMGHTHRPVRLVLRLEGPEGSSMRVEGSSAGPADARSVIALPELASVLLDALVDEYSLGTDGARARFHFVKHRLDGAAGGGDAW